MNENELLQEVKRRVEVSADENPVHSRIDAVNLLTRNGLLYRYDQNGSLWGLRWTPDDPPRYINDWELGRIACERIIEKIPPRSLGEVPPTTQSPKKPRAKNPNAG